MSKSKQKQYAAYKAAGGRMTKNKWEKDGSYDPDGNCLSAKNLQIGNFVFLVYDKHTPRKVQAIYDNAVFLEGRDEPDDERDLMPVPVTKQMLLLTGLKQNTQVQKMEALLPLPYIHLLQQLINLTNQSRFYADH